MKILNLFWYFCYKRQGRCKQSYLTKVIYFLHWLDIKWEAREDWNSWLVADPLTGWFLAGQLWLQPRPGSILLPRTKQLQVNTLYIFFIKKLKVFRLIFLVFLVFYNISFLLSVTMKLIAFLVNIITIGLLDIWNWFIYFIPLFIFTYFCLTPKKIFYFYCWGI